MESNNIDSLATRKKIRTVYGSVRSFCREAELTDTYPSLLLTEPRRGQRGEGQKVLQRLDSEGLIVYLFDDVQEVSNELERLAADRD